MLELSAFEMKVWAGIVLPERVGKTPEYLTDIAYDYNAIDRSHCDETNNIRNLTVRVTS